MRPSKDEYFMQMAHLVATRGTCLRRQVGCVLVNARGHVLATGYNGVPAGVQHCNTHDPYFDTGFPHACAGATAASGTCLDACMAVHAEQNALLQCRDVWDIDTVYVTASPCITCTKLLLNTGAARVVFSSAYPSAESQALWEKCRGVGTWKKSVQVSYTCV